MTCDVAMSKLMELDNEEPIREDVAAHLQECLICRREAEVLFQALGALEAQNLVVMTRDISADIMASIYEAEEHAEAHAETNRHIPMQSWIAAGVNILFGMILVPFSNSMAWLKDAFGSSLEIPLNIVLGIVIAAYATLFIGTHVDQVARKLGLRD